MIELDRSSKNLIEQILVKYTDLDNVYIFGSRIEGGARKSSDLDLFIRAKSPLTFEIKEAIRDDFSNSDLVILIDFHDWFDFTVSFQSLIESKCKKWKDLFPS